MHDVLVHCSDFLTNRRRGYPHAAKLLQHIQKIFNLNAPSLEESPKEITPTPVPPPAEEEVQVPCPAVITPEPALYPSTSAPSSQTVVEHQQPVSESHETQQEVHTSPEQAAPTLAEEMQVAVETVVTPTPSLPVPSIPQPIEVHTTGSMQEFTFPLWSKQDEEEEGTEDTVIMILARFYRNHVAVM